MIAQAPMQHSTSSSTLADILERVLDKGVVIVGDIKIKLVDIELLTIQIRLIIASVDKAREMGMDWWLLNPQLASKAAQPDQASHAGQASHPDDAAHADKADEVAELKRRLEKLESRASRQRVPPADRPAKT